MLEMVAQALLQLLLRHRLPGDLVMHQQPDLEGDVGHAQHVLLLVAFPLEPLHGLGIVVAVLVRDYRQDVLRHVEEAVPR